MTRDTAEGPLPVLPQFEAEDNLVASVERARRMADLGEIAHRTLGEWWGESWVRAPFEECLSVKQLLSLDMQSFIRKRSMTSEKLVAITCALDRALSADPASAPPRKAPRPALTRAAVPPPARSRGVGTSLPPRFAALARLVEYEMPYLEGYHTLAPFFVALTEAVSAEELIVLWLRAEGAQDIPAWPSASESEPTILAAVRRALEEHAPEVIRHWETAISGAGSRESSLLDPYIRPDCDPHVQRALLRIGLWAIGARAPLLRGSSVAAHWSSSPDSLEKILKALAPSLKAGRGDFREVLSLPLPFFDLDVLLEKISPPKPRRKRNPRRK